MANSYGSATVTTTASEVLAANSRRKGASFFNASSQTVYWGLDDSVSISNGFPIRPDGVFDNAGLQDAYRGAVYMIVEADTSDIRYVEWEQ